jgi:uncharacterized membrane protein YkvI
MSGAVFMTGDLKNVIKVACIYATSIIGAGFASGQEIMQFFSIYKTGGFYGILLAGFLFAVIGCIVLDKVYCDRIRNYEEFLFPSFGWIVGWILEIAVTLFMLCLFCIMLAGAGNVLSDRFGISFKFAVLIMGLISLVMILSNIKGIVALSTFVTPILIFGIVFAGLYIILFNSSEVISFSGFFTRFTGNWLFSSLIYVSYNSILAIVMMCSLQPYLKTAGTARLGGILGGVLLSLTAMIIHAAIFLFYPTAYEKELPILAILKNFSSTAGNLYAVILWLAMLVSAVTSGFCFTNRVSTTLKINKKVVTMVLCAAAVPLSTLGFSKLIAAIYPVFGYIGFFMIIVILANGISGLYNSNGRK